MLGESQRGNTEMCTEVCQKRSPSSLSKGQSCSASGSTPREEDEDEEDEEEGKVGILGLVGLGGVLVLSLLDLTLRRRLSLRREGLELEWWPSSCEREEGEGGGGARVERELTDAEGESKEGEGEEEPTNKDDEEERSILRGGIG